MQNIRSLHKLLKSYWDRQIQNNIKHLRWSASQNKYCLNASVQPEIFQGKGYFVELGHFNKLFAKNKGEKGLTGKHFLIFKKGMGRSPP